jgi:hypothetical protein
MIWLSSSSNEVEVEDISLRLERLGGSKLTGFRRFGEQFAFDVEILENGIDETATSAATSTYPSARIRLVSRCIDIQGFHLVFSVFSSFPTS